MLMNCVALLMLAGNRNYSEMLDSLQDAAKKVRTVIANEVKTFKHAHGIKESEKPTLKELQYTASLTRDFAAAHKKQEEAVSNSVSTSVIKQTLFFRGSQLALSEQSAEDLWNWYDETHTTAKNSKTFHYKTSAQLCRRVYVLACTAQRVTANKEEGYEEVDLFDEQYEVGRIVEHNIQHGRIRYRTRWMKNGMEDDEEKDTWEPHWIFEENAKDVLSNYLDQLKQIERQKITELEQREQQPPEKQLEKTKLQRQRASKIEKTYQIKQTQMEKAEEKVFDDKGKTTASFFTLWRRLSEDLQQGADIPVTHRRANDPDRFYEELVMTKRKGKFTEKVKAIRAFLIEEAEKGNDATLLRILVRKEIPFSEKRQLRFPMDPKFDYTGKPWFSLQTSVAEPNTEMLHTLTCRNMLDTKKSNAHLRNAEEAARNFSDFDVFVWDFDLIIKHRIFVNARFRFCKECKEYSEIADPQSSGNAEVDIAVQNHVRHRIVSPSPPSRPVRQKAPPIARPPPRAPSSVHSSHSADSVSTVSAGSTEYTLRSIPKSQYPLTELVSFFALHASLVDLTV